MKKLIALALLVCLVGAAFAAQHDTGTYHIFITAVGAAYYQVYIDQIPLSIHWVGTFADKEVAPGYHDVGIQLLDFDYTPLGGASYQERSNVYVGKDQTTNVYFNFDDIIRI